MSSSSIQVTDINGFQYTLKSPPLSSGGQGVVYDETSGTYVIKLLKGNQNMPEERLRQVRLLKLDDLKVTHIHSLLRAPDIGYVMMKLKGMQPLRMFMYPQDRYIRYGEWYKQTGGVYRRLRLLRKLADILVQLRSRGLIYGDISPNNVFVSERIEQDEVYLIDIDNITYESRATGSILTPSYGAPELVRGGVCISSRTDVYSFAVLVCEMLCGAHPLKGDIVLNDDPEIEQTALRGELPWIYHKSDKRNTTSYILPLEAAFTPELFKLLGRNFDIGLNEPEQRPNIMDWSDALFQAEHKTLICPDCKWSYFERLKQCPDCGAIKSLYYTAQVWIKYPVVDDEQEKWFTESSGLQPYVIQLHTPLVLTSRMIYPVLNETPLIEVEIRSKDRMYIKQLSDKTCYAITGSGRKVDITPSGVELTPETALHFDSLDNPHRIVSFKIGGNKS